MLSKTVAQFPSRAKPGGATLAERIRAARRCADLSQAELAARSGVTASAVAQWEHPGGTRPTLERLKLLAKTLDVPLDWLMSGGRLDDVGRRRGRDAETPAVLLDAYAQTAQEEELLLAFRRMGERARANLLALAQEFRVLRRASRLQLR